MSKTNKKTTKSSAKKVVKKVTKKSKKPSASVNKVKSLKKHINTDKTVKSHKNQLIQLQIEKQSLQRGFSSVLEQFNETVSTLNPKEDMLEKLPIENLQQLHNSTLPINPDMSVTKFLDERMNLRKQMEEQDSKMKNIEHQIQLTQIDLLLAKINVIMSNLD